MRHWILVLVLAACGDDAVDPNSCLPDGFADGTTTIGTEPVGPFVRGEVIRAGELYALAFDEAAGTCGETATTGTHVVLLLCDAPEAKNYRVVAKQQFRCPGAEVLALVEQDGPRDIAQSTSGVLMIEAAGSCVRGTYSVEFGNEMLEGAFDAVSCD